MEGDWQRCTLLNKKNQLCYETLKAQINMQSSSMDPNQGLQSL